jgi:Phosphomannomutase
MACTVEEMKLYETWLNSAKDADILAELKDVEGKDEEISDRFYRYLEFGTGGLRGVIGAGTNRMNIYTVSMAAQALADYLAQKGGSHAVAIGYDSRNKSTDFAKCAAATLASNGVKVHIFPELEPTPVLSYAVRELHCSAGIVITASHNPAKYNGFKCYGGDGCQMTDGAAGEVYSFMQKLDIFADVRRGDFDELMQQGMISWIDDSLVESFLDAVEACSINPGLCKDAGLKVIYTPLCGAGNKPVRAILKRIGIDDVTVVPEQELPDGNFPTCPYPNPEIRQAFECALKLAGEVQPDLLLATDPDSDRMGIAVRSADGYKLMSGNEVGAMILDYMLSCRKAQGNLPQNPVCVSTIVSSDLGTVIAEKYGCEMRRVLTGFKYIGEIIGQLEAKGEKDRFIMGYEESYGYLCGTYARDKDAVVAAMMVCEMAAYYKKQGKSLLDVMDELYNEFGFYRNRLLNYEFEGEAGMRIMNSIMDRLREDSPKEIAGDKVLTASDYKLSVQKNLTDGTESDITLPKSNVLSYKLENGGSFIVRPSGTEPKIKVYAAAVGTPESAEAKLDEFEKAANVIMGK